MNARKKLEAKLLADAHDISVLLTEGNDLLAHIDAERDRLGVRRNQVKTRVAELHEMADSIGLLLRAVQAGENVQLRDLPQSLIDGGWRDA